MLTFAVAVALVSTFPKEPTANEALQSLAREDAQTLLIMNGIGIGLTYANAELRVRGDRPIYCAPPNLPLTADGVVQILRNLVEQRPVMGELPLGAVTVSAFQFTFPCQ